MREHLKVFLHTALVIIGLEPTTQCELLRGLKRQQWYEDWLLPVLRERNKVVLGTRGWSNTPLPSKDETQEEEASPRATAISSCRRGILRSIPAYFPHLTPKS